MINPYSNRDNTNRNIRLAERGARITATITTSLGAFVWGQDLAARYLPIEWSITPFLTAATGALAGLIMGYLTDFMFGNLLQRVTYDTLAARHPNVTKWNGPEYFKTLRRAESILFGVLLIGLFAIDIYTTLIIRDPIADKARTDATTDIAAATATVTAAQTTATAPMAAQLKDLEKRIHDEERRASNANPSLRDLASQGNNWARQKIESQKSRATRSLRKQYDELSLSYNKALSGQNSTLETTQRQISEANDRTAAANARNREVMAGMYVAFTVAPKILSIILRILMVITFLAYSVNFHPDLTGDGIIDYADVEAYFQRQKQEYEKRTAAARRPTPPQAPPPPMHPQSPQNF